MIWNANLLHQLICRSLCRNWWLNVDFTCMVSSWAMQYFQYHMQFSNPIAILVILLVRVCQNHNGKCLHMCALWYSIAICFVQPLLWIQPMACYTCMEVREIMCHSIIGHAIVCWLLLLQIRCTKHGWLTALEVVTKLGDRMVWNSTAQPQGPCHTIVVNKNILCAIVLLQHV